MNQNFEQMLEEQMGTMSFNKNEIVNATVVNINQHFIELDVSLHTNAFLKRDEVPYEPKVGDTLKVIIEALDNGVGEIELTHKEFMVEQQKDSIPQIMENGESVECTVIEARSKGLIARFGYLEGFIPRRSVDVVPVDDLDQYIGKKLLAKIINNDVAHGNVVLSPKHHIIAERGGHIEKLEKAPEVGDVLEGKVTNVVQFGAFIDIGGITSLLHISDYAWDMTDVNPSDLEIGQRVTVMVKSIDEPKGLYQLSQKHADMTPWEKAKQQMPIGSQHVAKIIKVKKDGGLFVSVNGVPAIIQNTEIAWTRMTISHMKSIFNHGDEINVLIEGFDNAIGFENIQCSHRKTLDNPWVELESKFKVGNEIDVMVSSIQDSMAFVKITDQIDAIVHDVEQLSGKKVGDFIKVRLTHISPEERKVVAVLPSAKRAFAKNPYKRGQKVVGTIAKIEKDQSLVITVQGSPKGVSTVVRRNAVFAGKSWLAEDLVEGQEHSFTVHRYNFKDKVAELGFERPETEFGTTSNQMAEQLKGVVVR
ncbi:TPA: S1 RNA-binding domain-containing protein [Vibrio vulnificus]|uniref:S1 RNA-binding domain-containing protein n=1 Tax=Vibrio vulnificus TaxID=672 RepID=A0A8H9TFK9_VIBVL|nr:S1 RNA-binding domain-containing protein [Vibrio vulnificus]HAS8540997.1 S1 RNA-binding domain-containing protein [Vibrio vulnificus]